MSKAKLSMVMYVMCLALSTGCAAWTDKSKKDSKWSSMQFWKKPYQRPTKVAAIWTHDILAMTGKPPTRGFGGRLYFYNDKSQTIPVDGELVVHGYEEVRIGLALQAEKTQADKTFMFTAEQFTEHFGSSDLGASYSIWIPWDGADGVQKEITLITTFKGKDGTILQGEPAKLVLPGRKVEDPFANAAIQHVSIQQSQTPTNMGPLPQLSGLRTTTISVPGQINRAAERNNNSANASSVVVHDSVHKAQTYAAQQYNAQPYYGQPNTATNSNMMYASSPTAARANAMLAAYGAQNHSSQVAANPTGSNPTTTSQPTYQLTNGAPFPSTMPNAVQGSMQNQLQNQYNGVHHNGLQYNSLPNNNLHTPNFQVPSSSGPAFPNQQIPNQQNPQVPSPMGQPQPNMNNQPFPANNMNPGFAGYSPLPVGAVEAAFASTPQFQPLGQTRTQSNQVQPAGFSSTLNSASPVVTSGMAQGQLPVQVGQPIFQR